MRQNRTAVGDPGWRAEEAASQARVLLGTDPRSPASRCGGVRDKIIEAGDAVAEHRTEALT